jgi:hypothetical protein
MWNPILVYLEIVLILMHDRSTVCTEHNISSILVLDRANRTPL